MFFSVVAPNNTVALEHYSATIRTHGVFNVDIEHICVVLDDPLISRSPIDPSSVDNSLFPISSSLAEDMIPHSTVHVSEDLSTVVAHNNTVALEHYSTVHVPTAMPIPDTPISVDQGVQCASLSCTATFASQSAQGCTTVVSSILIDRSPWPTTTAPESYSALVTVLASVIHIGFSAVTPSLGSNDL